MKEDKEFTKVQLEQLEDFKEIVKSEIGFIILCANGNEKRLSLSTNIGSKDLRRKIYESALDKDDKDL